MRHIVPAAFCRLGFVSYIWDQNRKTYEKTPVLPRGGSPLRLWRSRSLYQFHRNAKGHRPTARPWSPMPPIRTRSTAPCTTRPGGKFRAGAMLPVYEWDTGRYLDGHPAGGRNLFHRRQHERAFAHHRRNDLRRPPGTGRTRQGCIDYGSLIYITLQRAKHRPRGDPHDRRAGRTPTDMPRAASRSRSSTPKRRGSWS